MNARDIVTSRMAQQAGRFPDLGLEPLDVSGLDGRDAALALAIEHATLRHWLTLTAVLESQLSRPWDQLEMKMQAVLLVGAAQLLYMDKLPDHAVVSEAVEWIKRSLGGRGAKAAGMVNAVLRKVAGLRREMIPATERISVTDEKRCQTPFFDRDELPLSDGRVWKLTQPVFDEQPLRRLAQQTSHPEALLAHWSAAFGHERIHALATHSTVHAPMIVHGVSGPAVVLASHPSLLPHDEQGFFVFTGDRQALLAFLGDHPAAIVQDPTSAAAVRATGDVSPPPALILDVCAGKGTKTRQLAAIHTNASIIATDIDQGRLAILRRQFEGHARVKVIEHNDLYHYGAKADLIVMDVPCSNTGVFARRVEAKYRFSRESLERIVKVQRQIIADALPLLAPNGRLLYSTCSIEPQENQQTAEWVMKWHPFRIGASKVRLPHGLPGDSAAGYQDGGFFALLERATSPRA